MAIMTTIDCPVCGESKQESRPGNDYSKECRECKNKIKAEKRLCHLKGLEALTVEERLKKIEEWIYDYRKPVDPRSVVYG